MSTNDRIVAHVTVSEMGEWFFARGVAGVTAVMNPDMVDGFIYRVLFRDPLNLTDAIRVKPLTSHFVLDGMVGVTVENDQIVEALVKVVGSYGLTHRGPFVLYVERGN